MDGRSWHVAKLGLLFFYTRTGSHQGFLGEWRQGEERASIIQFAWGCFLRSSTSERFMKVDDVEWSTAGWEAERRKGVISAIDDMTLFMSKDYICPGEARSI
jgi:hypothetical protein